LVQRKKNSIFKAADLNKLKQGGEAFLSFPFTKDSMLKVFLHKKFQVYLSSTSIASLGVVSSGFSVAQGAAIDGRGRFVSLFGDSVDGGSGGGLFGLLGGAVLGRGGRVGLLGGAVLGVQLFSGSLSAFLGIAVGKGDED
jgi:hypothetical protein